MCVQGLLLNIARTAGPIVTGEAPFDSPIRRNDDGSNLESISSTWHVARAAPSRLAKKFARNYTSNGGHHRPHTHRSHVYCTNLKSIGGAVPVGCTLRAPGPEKFIREGSSGSRKVVAIDTKFGTQMEFNERNSIAYVIS